MSEMDVNCPRPVTEHDREAFERVFATTWLQKCVQPTGTYGRRTADVQILDLPPNLVASVFLIPSDETDAYSAPKENAIRLVLMRWDINAVKGWNAFPLSLRFADNSVMEVVVPASSDLSDGQSLVIDTSSLVSEIAYHNDRQIPRIVFNISAPLVKRRDYVRDYLSRRREVTKMMQARSLFVVIEDEDMDRLAAESTIPDFNTAYKALIPGSFKADLMRFYVLYMFGGVYFDDKSIMRHSLDSEAFNSILAGEGNGESRCDMFVSCEEKRIEIACMGARQASPIMLMGIEQCIKNIMERYYGYDRLCITGNLMITPLLEAKGMVPLVPLYSKYVDIQWEKCVGEIIGRLIIDPDLQRIRVKKSGKVASGNIPKVLKLDPAESRPAFKEISANSDANLDILWDRYLPWISWPRGNGYYTFIWHIRQVYIDGNPPLLSGVKLVMVIFAVVAVMAGLAFATTFVPVGHF